MKNEIKILKDWLESEDNSLEKLREIKWVCSGIASYTEKDPYDYKDISVAVYDAYSDIAAFPAIYYARFDNFDAPAYICTARGKVKTLVDLLESHTSNNTNNNDNAQKLSELSKDELIETFGNVPINKLDFTLNDLIRALK